MQNKKDNPSLHFNCLFCEAPIYFSIFEIEHLPSLSCEGCSKQYAINDPVLIRQLKKFEALCRQLQESEEILGNACIGIDVGEHQVKIPYKLLLTRLNSSLELTMNGKKVVITFRTEPNQENFLSRELESRL